MGRPAGWTAARESMGVPMIVTRVVRPTFRVERDIVWQNDDDTRTQHVVRTFLTERGAYLCAARWMIFKRRDELHDGIMCTLCNMRWPVEGETQGTLEPCRYHDRERFDVLAKRLARWLRCVDHLNARLLQAGTCVQPLRTVGDDGS